VKVIKQDLGISGFTISDTSDIAIAEYDLNRDEIEHISMEPFRRKISRIHVVAPTASAISSTVALDHCPT